MPTPITTADLEAATGLTKRQVLADVRAGLLPGYIRRGGQYVCPPGEFERWQRGEWIARPQPQPVQLLHKRGVA